MTSPIPPRPAGPPAPNPQDYFSVPGMAFIPGDGHGAAPRPQAPKGAPKTTKATKVASSSGQAAPPAGRNTGGGVPGADFMSNEDIRAFCEHLRKEARVRATERALDADHLETVLRAIPDMTGSMSRSRARARRVSRWLKKVAAAEKAIQKYSAAVYAAFEREYDSELRTIGRGRVQAPARGPFKWTR